MFFPLFDMLTGLGLLASAIVGLIYFFSRDYRARKKKEWRHQRGTQSVAEWGEWILGAVMVIVVLAAIVIAYSSGDKPQ